MLLFFYQRFFWNLKKYFLLNDNLSHLIKSRAANWTSCILTLACWYRAGPQFVPYFTCPINTSYSTENNKFMNFSLMSLLCQWEGCLAKYVSKHEIISRLQVWRFAIWCQFEIILGVCCKRFDFLVSLDSTSFTIFVLCPLFWPPLSHVLIHHVPYFVHSCPVLSCILIGMSRILFNQSWQP